MVAEGADRRPGIAPLAPHRAMGRARVHVDLPRPHRHEQVPNACSVDGARVAAFCREGASPAATVTASGATASAAGTPVVTASTDAGPRCRGAAPGTATGEVDHGRAAIRTWYAAAGAGGQFVGRRAPPAATAAASARRPRGPCPATSARHRPATCLGSRREQYRREGRVDLSTHRHRGQVDSGPRHGRRTCSPGSQAAST